MANYAARWRFLKAFNAFFLKAVFWAVLVLTPFSAMAGGEVRVEFSKLARLLPWEEMPGALNSGGVRLYAARDSIGTGERWFEFIVKLDVNSTDISGTGLHVSVKGGNGDRPLEELKAPVASDSALVRVDMRSLGREHVRISVQWNDKAGKVLGTGETSWVAAAPASPLEPGTRIPVKLDIPDGGGGLENYPVRFGLPLPEGAVWKEAGLKVVDEKGAELPSQLEIAGRWFEGGSVKWMWVDALISGREGFFVEAGERTEKSLPGRPVKVEQISGGFLVSTGPAEYKVGAGGSLINEVRFNGRAVVSQGKTRGLYLVDNKGRTATASSRGASMRLESEGPVSAVIRIEGFYMTSSGEQLAGHITRLKFTAGRKEAEATHTLILTNNTNEIWFRDVGWEFEVAGGSGQQVFFSLSPRSPGEDVLSLPVGGGKILSMLQSEGVNLGLMPVVRYWKRSPPYTAWQRYMRGEYSFVIRGNGQDKILHEGGKMGDWAALAGKNSGWMFSCRDSAAQHPKEFEAAENRLSLKLFSSASGRELDFTMESMMKNWGMSPKKMIKSGDEVSQDLLQEYLDFIAGHENNAAGWSKTHEILFSFFENAADAAKLSLLHSGQVFAHVSPRWIRDTDAMGRLSPKDKKRFPAEETVIDGIFWGIAESDCAGPEGGFIDYHAGPHRLIHSWRTGAYTFRTESWYLYARSAERGLRELAQGSNRVYLDGNMSHWDLPGKPRGLFIGAKNPTGDRPDVRGKKRERTRQADLPLYWEGVGRYEMETLVNMDQALLDYYLTGYRRSGDLISNYARTVKENLSPENFPGWRPKLAARQIAKAYELTREPRLRELIYEIIMLNVYDPEGEFLFSRRYPTYKMGTEGDVPLELWKLLRDPLFYRMSMEIARWNWEKYASVIPPLGGRFGQNRASGFLGHFLWEETGCPSIISGFDYARRRLVADRLIDLETERVRTICTSQLPRFLKGLPLAMDVVARAEEENRVQGAWIAFEIKKAPVSIFFSKPGSVYGRLNKESGDTSMELLVRQEWTREMEESFKLGNREAMFFGGFADLKPHAKVSDIWAHDRHTITQVSGGETKVRINKNAPAGSYELVILKPGIYSVFSSIRAPLALYAPGGWTAVKMNPPVKTYFRVQEGLPGKIFFEKGASLFKPGGEPYEGGEELKGWVNLPEGSPGLWSFESVDAGDVKVENLPGFFAQGGPQLYMENE